MRRRTVVVAVALLALVVAACGGRGEEASGDREGAGAGGEYPDPGISDDEVVFGHSGPFSGPASVFGTIARATEAYFRFVNEERGGVRMGDGKTRKLRLIAYDDGYTPSRAVENARRLIEKDGVFALHAVLGTPTITAIWDLVEEAEVPNLFVQTGATKWGADLEDHRYTISGYMAYSTASLIYADWLRENMPDARVAILYQNDDFGKDYRNGLLRGIEGSGVEVVAEETYETTDPDVSSQLTNLAQSGADVFFLVSTGKFTVQALAKKQELGWRPQTIVHYTNANIETVFKPAGIETSMGTIGVKLLKEPGEPAWEDDPAMREYKEKVVRYGQNIDVLDFNNVNAWALGEALVKVLERTPEPTRESLLETVRSLDGLQVGLFLPGVEMRTGPDDGFPLESGQLVRFNGTGFENLGEPRSFEGETPTEDVPGLE